MARRLFLAALVACLLISQLGICALSAASETDNFAQGYTLTGDGAADMVAIAMAQEGRTGSDFGYDDQWCAYFVSDCARIAGETGAIPAHGTCTYLYQNILNAGGTVTTNDPRPGDICFINWSGGSRMSHVEIVYRVEDGMVYTIGGNSGSEKHYLTRCVKRHDPIEEVCILAIVRPNYGAEPAPVQPELTEPPKPPQPVTYQVWFDAAGGCDAPETCTKTQGKELILPQQIPLRRGYRFLGWLCSDGRCYEPGSNYTRDADALLVAQWKSSLRRIRLGPDPHGMQQRAISSMRIGIHGARMHTIITHQLREGMFSYEFR